MRLPYRVQLLIIFSFLILISCGSDSYKGDNWERSFTNDGSSSSPKASDLNGDGIKDIIIGAGSKEFTQTEHGVLALDGKDGSILWQVPARNQIVGTPLLKDFTGDGIDDVLIGGRSAILYLINGVDGQIIWQFQEDSAGQDLINDTTSLNFFNPQICPDLDNDGKEDIIISFGGFIRAKPTETDRPKGYILGLSGASGAELRRMATPDGKEIYSSPVIADLNDGQGTQLFFGTGGETIGGGFYSISMEDFNAEKYNAIINLVSDTSKGFIAPPLIADMNKDEVSDIIINAVNGKVYCLDGLTKNELWTADLGSGYEGYAMACPGYFYGDDDVLDLFCTFGFGPWPYTKYTRNLLINGQDGSIQYADSAGTFQYASPVTYEFTGDKSEDVLMAINKPIITTLPNTSIPTTFLGNQLSIYNLKDGKIEQLRPIKIGSNLGSTPLLTDLDDDGYLDVISCYMTDPVDFYSFSKMVVERIELDIPTDHPFKWPSYMGPNTNSIYKIN